MSKKLLRSILLGLILTSNGGCVAALLVGGGAGAGTVAYLKGELKSMEDASLDKTWKAAQKALEDVELTVTSKQKDAISAKLIAYGVNDKKTEVTLKKASGNLTEVRIRVGIFGDESLSRLILEKIRKYV